MMKWKGFGRKWSLTNFKVLPHIHLDGPRTIAKISVKIIGLRTEGSGRSLILRYYPSISLESLRKTTRNLSLGCRFPSRDLKPAFPSNTKQGRRVNHLITTFGFKG
jgi:hypothetical protein